MSKALGTSALALLLLACASEGGPPQETVSGVRWLDYDTTFHYSAERPEAEAGCGPAVHFGPTSGHLGLTPTGASQFSLFWQGMGCDIVVTGQSDGPFVAASAPCRLRSDARLATFGITGVHFDSLELDSSGDLTAKGRVERTVDGSRTAYCFEIPSP